MIHPTPRLIHTFANPKHINTPFRDASIDFETTSSSIQQLVSTLSSASIEAQRQAALEIRLLAKNCSENRLHLAEAGAIEPLIKLISSTDSQLQEYSVTAILNLTLNDESKQAVFDAGAVQPLIQALKSGTSITKENAACSLLRLSQLSDGKSRIGRSGGIPLLVELLNNGTIRGKKDAATALFVVCALKENKVKAVRSGIMRILVELMADLGNLNLVDKALCVVNLLILVKEGKECLVEEGGIVVLVEIVEVGTQRQKEIAAAILLCLCEDSCLWRNMVAREGAIPPLVALTQCGTTGAKQKAEVLIELLRRPRSENGASRGASIATQVLSA